MMQFMDVLYKVLLYFYLSEVLNGLIKNKEIAYDLENLCYFIMSNSRNIFIYKESNINIWDIKTFIDENLSESKVYAAYELSMIFYSCQLFNLFYRNIKSKGEYCIHHIFTLSLLILSHNINKHAYGLVIMVLHNL